jgi:hypothetical protein
MPKKLAVAALKAALQDSPEAAKEFFKKKFIPGFYHGSPSPNITAFDPNATPNKFVTDAAGLNKPRGATWVTQDPGFADEFLPPGVNAKQPYRTGSTMYPVSVNLGNSFDPTNPESLAVLQNYLKSNPKAFPNYLGAKKDLPKYFSKGDWDILEDSDFMKHLQSLGHDSMVVTEGGQKNVAVFNPQNIRGKFAKYDPAEEFNPDFMKAKGGSIDLPEGGDLVHQQVPSNLPNVNLSVHGMPSMNGMPGVGYMQTPQGAMARMQLEKELADNAKMRAAVSASAMAIPGLHGVKTMPGQIEAGYNAPMGPGRADIGAFRTINPIPGKGHIQGINARYTIPFKKGGKVS